MTTTYSHRKSNREVTDEQFSDGTTIDGTRIDSALTDVVERMNNIRKGDIATRFVQKQLVFGYQPFSYPEADTKAKDGLSYTYRRSFTRFPWLFITNNEHTTVDPQPNAPETIPSNYDYPAENYGNRYRYKGTYLDSLHGVETVSNESKKVSLNKGPWIHPFWKTWWMHNFDITGAVMQNAFDVFSQHTARVATGANVGGTDVFATVSNNTSYTAARTGLTDLASDATDVVGWPCHQNHYQMAWSHSWAFPKATIVDDVMFFMRTDTTAYTADFISDYLSTATDADQLTLQLSVDSPFNYGDRRLNDVIVMQHQVKLTEVLFAPGGVQSVAPTDMKPNVPTAADAKLQGPIIRLRDLNIPLPPGSNLRLTVVIPWFVDNGRYRLEGTDESAGEDQDLQTHMAMGGTWPSVDLRQEAFTTADTTTGKNYNGYQMVQPSGQTLFATATVTNTQDVIVIKTWSDSAASDPAAHHLTSGDRITLLSVAGWDAVGIGVAAPAAGTGNTITVTAFETFTVPLGATASGTDTSITLAYASPKFRWPADQCGWAGSPRWESMHDWAPGGCVTVLEEICD